MTERDRALLEERARLMSRLGSDAKMIGFREAAQIYFASAMRLIVDLDALEGKMP